MATFGDTTAGGTVYPGNNDRSVLSKFTNTDNALISAINVRYNSTSSAGANSKALIYSDSAGEPGTLLGVSSVVAIPNAGGDLTHAISLTVAPGTYWLGAVTDNFQGVWQLDASGGQFRSRNTTTYATPATTWGTSDATGTTQVNAYATYTVANAPSSASIPTPGPGVGPNRPIQFLASLKATDVARKVVAAPSSALIPPVLPRQGPAILLGRAWVQGATDSPGSQLTSVALTGQSVSFSLGTITPSIAYATSAQSASFSEGTPTGSIAYGLTAQTATFSEGVISPAISVGVTGQTSTFAEGALLTGISYGLTAQTATFTEGTISASAGGDLTLTLTGQTATFSEGLIAPSITSSLAAQTATFTEGSLSPTINYSASSQSASFTEGTISVTAGGDITLTLSGLVSSFSLGTITAAGGDVSVRRIGGGVKRTPYKRTHKTIDEIVAYVDEIYADLMATPEAPAAKTIVAPFVSPDAPEINWPALAKNAEKVAALVALWRQHEIESDDEDALLLV